MQKDPVVIIGGGFAGVYTAKELLKRKLPVLLISDTNHFTFTPLLHEVATGSLISHDVIFEYESFFKEDGFQFIRGYVDGIDKGKKTVSLGTDKIAYSQLVIATGATTNFWNIKGAENAVALKNVEDAVKLKKSILQVAQDVDHHVEVSVVGGGPTGLELVFDIVLMLKALKKKNSDIRFTVRIINAMDALCLSNTQTVDGYCGRALIKAGIEVVCGARCTEVTPTEVMTTMGAFNSDVTVLCTGVRPNTDVFKNDIDLDERGHIDVNQHLQTIQDPSIFAVGDVAAIDGKPIPKLAQTAVREAPVAARNIAIVHRDSGESMRIYTPKVIGTLYSLGFGDGVGQVQGRVVKGVLAWYLWRTVYLFKTPGLSNKLRVAFSWTLGLFQGRNLTEL
jgi:NADH:ubiquinone reductase (H+-translocating)